MFIFILIYISKFHVNVDSFFILKNDDMSIYRINVRETGYFEKVQKSSYQFIIYLFVIYSFKLNHGLIYTFIFNLLE